MIEVFDIKEGLYFGLLNLNPFAKANHLNTKREIENQGKRYLLNKLLGEEIEIEYDTKGKPYLPNNSKHISISHSHDKLAIIINENEPTGIDIELIRDKVLKIKHKFLSVTELSDSNDDVEKLLIYWAAKETLYKIYGLKEVDFIEHLFVKPFTKHNLGVIIGKINLPNFNETFELHYQLLEDYVLVYALNKINNNTD
ncbi:MAG: 4'-phosphopantetheinyl transferase superfamily protein [Bacteroidia bacterium]|nr:4'-phosphopantetheinyl transferase superfamily protein [Bacteroidia bacterium]